MRDLASIRIVDSVEPIEGADAIEVATVGGWKVVVKKGEIEAGRPAVYFEIDSFLPKDDPRFSFLMSKTRTLEDGSVGHALRTIKLRGQISQGLLLPMTAFPELIGIPAGTDVTKRLGIRKWEKPVPATMGGQIAGGFPTHMVMKTDSERVQNLTKYWDELSKFDWYATEKVDGTSLTVINDEGTVRVFSRNWEQAEDPNNVYWKMASAHIADLMVPGAFVQAEIFGPGIQSNPLGVSELQVAVFSVGYLGAMSPLPRSSWSQDLQTLAAPIYEDLSFPDSVDAGISEIDGIRSLISPGRLTEGVVYHTVDGSVPKCLGRPNFKIISNKFLLKGD